MKRTILFLAIAIIGVASLAAENVKVPTYIIDGKKVENFDGSQLKGKTIANYTIDDATKVHVILTTEKVAGKTVSNVSVCQATRPVKNGSKMTMTYESDVYKPGETVFVFDGKLIYASEFTSLSPSVLSSIEMVSDKTNSKFKKYAEEAKKQLNSGIEPKCVLIVTSK